MHRKPMHQKKVFFILLFWLVSTTSFSQYVHKIKADSVKITNDSCNAELILENSTRHVQGGFLYNKGAGRTEFRKVMTKLGDNEYLIDGDTLKAGSNAILNQYTQKQTGNYWIDTAKSIRSLLVDTLGNTQVDFNGSAGTLINWTDRYPYKGLQSSVGSYNYPGSPLQFSSVADSGSRYRRNTIGVFEKGIAGTVGQTVWGDNVFWPTEPVLWSRAYYAFKLPTSKTITLSANKDYLNAGTLSSYSIGMQSIGNDTATIQTGYGQGAAINHFLRYDGFPWSAENVRHKGQYINSYSYLDFHSKSGSFMESFIDYYAGGQNNYNSGQILKQKINFFAANDQYGYTDRSYGFYQDGSDKLNFFGGKVMIKDSSLLNSDLYDLYVGGSSKFAGTIVQSSGRTVLGGAIDDGSTTLQVHGGAKVRGQFVIDYKNNAGIYGSSLRMGGYHTSMYYGANALNSHNATAFANNWFQNSAFGFAALQSCNGGNNNDAFGGWALGQVTSGSENTAFGRDAQGNNQTGYRNTSIGLVSLYDLTTGQYNTAVGNRTGRGITTGNYNTIIGAWVNGLAPNLERTVIISTGEPTGSAAWRMYSPSSGNVLFGTTSDDNANKVQVNGSVKATTFVTTQTAMPTSSADPSGQQGEIRADDNYIYFKTSTGWKRASLTTF